MIYSVRHCGVDKDSNRIWGYIRYTYGYFDDGVIFWGKKNGKLFFKRTRLDHDFTKNKFKKVKKYTHCQDLVDTVKKEYEELMLMKILSGGDPIFLV